MLSYVDMIGLGHSIAILCDAAQMVCDVAALTFQAHANYGTWSKDFVIFVTYSWAG